MIIEPHRSYWLEYDPANIDIVEYLDIPKYDEPMVIERPTAFLKYPISQAMECFVSENHEDAVNYVLQNQNVLPVFDSTFPIVLADRLFIGIITHRTLRCQKHL